MPVLGRLSCRTAVNKNGAMSNRHGLHANNPSAPEVEAGGSEIQGNPWLCGEFKARLERKERGKGRGRGRDSSFMSTA